jgi:hypothetical protein
MPELSRGDVRLLATALSLVIGGIASYRAWRLRRASASWPVVEGKILSGRARGIRDGGQVNWCAVLTYTFTTVDGSYYAGRFEHPTETEEEADEYVRQMKDARVSVRYRPGDPDTSFGTPV